MYAQRYVPHLPAAGEVVIFDRSWYNRAGVERVMGFCTEEQARGFLKMVPLIERAIVDSGVILLKYWLEVSPDEQTRRLEARIDDGRKIWKLSDMDLKSYSRWYDYSRARDEMFLATDTSLGAVVRRPFRQQAARAAERANPHPEQDPLRGDQAAESRIAETAGPRRPEGNRLSVQGDPGGFLS